MTIKVISLNLWWGGELMPAILEFLKSEAADIVCLQEVHDGHSNSLKDRQRSMEILRAQLHYPYDTFAKAMFIQATEGKIPLGNAVLSKYPIIHSTPTFLVESTLELYLDIPEQWPIFPRLLQHVGVDTPAGEVNLFNMHGVWDMDGDNYSARRKRMSEVIIAETSSKSNVILTGDSNTKASNPAMRQLEKHLKPVFGDELITTFNMRHKDNPGYATAAVDLMYISPEIKVMSRQCPNVDISDHRPLVVTLEI